MLERAGGDRLHDLLLGRLRPLEQGDPLAEPKHGDPVGALEDVVEVVGDDHDAEVPLGETADEVEHLTGLRDPEGGRRLVEDDELRVPHDGLRHRHRLALASGEPGHALTDRPERRHREAVQGLA